MNTRFVIGGLALLVGAGLIALTFSQRGAPWGFRDRAGVIIEELGAVEVTAGLMNPSAMGTTLKGAEVHGLYLGDEIRTGPLSMAKIKMPDIAFKVGGGSQLRLDDDGGLTLLRGSLTLDVPRSERVVRIRGGGGEVAFEEGAFDLVADGRAGNLFVLVRRGKATAIAKDANTPLAAQDLLKLAKGVPEISEPPTDVGLKARCKRGAGEGNSKPRLVSGQAPEGTLLLVEGRLSYPANDATFLVKLPPSEKKVIVFARAPGGAATEVLLNCGR